MDENPWIVPTLDEFLFFCCPECENKSPNKTLFINHALSNHPWVSNLSNESDDSDDSDDF